MPRTSLLSLALSLSLLAPAAGPAVGQPVETVLPATTKALLVTPDYEAFREKWNETELGRLAKDPAMEPFVADLRRQIDEKLAQIDVRLGLTMEDLRGVTAGEVALAVIQPGGMPDEHALAIAADVTGRRAELDELLAKIDEKRRDRGARKSQRTHRGVTIDVYTLPRRAGEVEIVQIHQFVAGDRFVAIDHGKEADAIIERLLGIGAGSLAEHEVHISATARLDAEESATAPQLRWFLEPFGYAEVARAASGGKKKRGTDVLAVLRGQGFTAVKAAAGHVTLADGDHELLHQSFIYAPGVPGAHPNERFTLAARMLAFPNGGTHEPPAWVPGNSVSYLSFNWKVREAFEHSKTLVNEIAGDEVFEEILEGIKTDPHGPKVDVRKELVAHLSERAILISDVLLPVTPKSQRMALAIELRDAEAVARTVDKTMEKDPQAAQREFMGHVIWEMLEDEGDGGEGLNIDGPEELNPFADAPREKPADKAKERPILPNSAVAVVHGHLIFATQVDYIRDLIADAETAENLAAAEDYQTVMAALDHLGGSADSFRFFLRTDEAARTSYELMKQGKMPQSETILGRILNGLLGPEEEGAIREQEIDGSQMPDFESVRRFLGPAGFYIRTEDDGWFIGGCQLSKG